MSFAERVRAVIANTASGEVVTYGEVAAEAGAPGAARAVGAVLRSSDGLPWWRVVNAAGRLAPGHEVEQARRLTAEGVPVTGNRVDGLAARRSGLAARRSGFAARVDGLAARRSGFAAGHPRR